MESVQTAANVSEAKITDQPIRDSIPNNRAKRAFGSYFQPVSEFKTA